MYKYLEWCVVIPSSPNPVVSQSSIHTYSVSNSLDTLTPSPAYEYESLAYVISIPCNKVSTVLILFINPFLTPAKRTPLDNEPPAGFNSPPCLVLLPSTLKPSIPMFSALPLMSKFVTTIASLGASSDNLIVVAVLPSPLKIVLLGNFKPFTM